MTIYCPITQDSYDMCAIKECLYHIDSKMDYNCGCKMNVSQLAHMKKVVDYPKKVGVGKINIARCIVLYELIESVSSKIPFSSTVHRNHLDTDTLDMLVSLVLRFPYTWTPEWTVDRLCQAIIDYPKWAKNKGCSLPGYKVFGLPEEIIENIGHTLLQ